MANEGVDLIPSILVTTVSPTCTGTFVDVDDWICQVDAAMPEIGGGIPVLDQGGAEDARLYVFVDVLDQMLQVERCGGSHAWLAMPSPPQPIALPMGGKWQLELLRQSAHRDLSAPHGWPRQLLHLPVASCYSQHPSCHHQGPRSWPAQPHVAQLPPLPPGQAGAAQA